MVDYQLELIVLPVADVDRAKEFYTRLGFREDLDYVGGEGFRVVHFTPPGSHCSIVIGEGIGTAAPGSTENVHLIVSDIEEARADLLGRGVEVSEIFHDADGVFHHAGTEKRVPGLYPGRRSYGSFASFTDPDGNQFMLQEITERLPGR
ncbi:glyoxalase [Micromonospora musae]|uniref:Glyoxalase n=1 Tax=Micromonospora musae TaxID=1894970 RepID=A0A3A9YHK8_9ACTN|nr:VOC family protein [Micromonospora musae]RKN22653.1 glyoxalase [Micromonospora musae]RKN34194.1 glyoxalase [Micromonospora musae]